VCASLLHAGLVVDLAHSFEERPTQGARATFRLPLPSVLRLLPCIRTPPTPVRASFLKFGEIAHLTQTAIRLFPFLTCQPYPTP
jgi:hypothetical protein